ncbi:Lhr family helicase [Leadbettera azotonutricia]|uniref:Lhr family helicase n=1 Tax=Leadbettera azotonutricia TaxID=150829 RepID=UPI0011D25CBD|nr:hypothetical protein [Leadbettera azotonutricia]
MDLAQINTNTDDFAEILPRDFFNIPRSFWEIKNASGLNMEACAEALWKSVWKGCLSSDSWEPLRRALAQGFASAQTGEEAPALETYPRGMRRIPRALRERWRSGPPVLGSWFSLAEDEGPSPEEFDPLEEDELNKDRVRILLGRWGVLSRPLLEREAPCFSWSRLLPSIRRMELAGELTAGRFFAGINSLQFASPAIGQELEKAETLKDIYWMNAADPASPAGLAVSGIEAGGNLPSRIASSRLCYRGSELLAVSNRGGKDIKICIPPDDPSLPEVLEFARISRTRAISPETKIIIEKINGKNAASGDYGALLKEMGFVSDRGRLILW